MKTLLDELVAAVPQMNPKRRALARALPPGLPFKIQGQIWYVTNYREDGQSVHACTEDPRDVDVRDVRSATRAQIFDRALVEERRCDRVME